MSGGSKPKLAAHLRRHARKLHNIACGFGRQRDADDIIQILYGRWLRRTLREPSWSPPEETSALFVCVKRVVIDQYDKESRERARIEQLSQCQASSIPCVEDALDAFQRLSWILAHLPAQSAEALTASLSAGRQDDAAVARELGITRSAYTARLYKARRAAEELARYYDLLTPEQAELMAALTYGGKSHAQLAHELSLLVDELVARWRQALEVLAKHGSVAAL